MGEASILFQPIRIGTKTAPNRIVFNAMECCDADKQGNPSELTYRRYRRCMEGGPGVIVIEAISVIDESRGRLNQLIGTRQNLKALSELIAGLRSVNPDPLLLV
jgi:2,4-dienoyl-CoA reductase-like NADH-dependent reductase (Old Yellow Enzyme family)